MKEKELEKEKTEKAVSEEKETKEAAASEKENKEMILILRLVRDWCS